MIISIHIPKTGGTTFRDLLRKTFADDIAYFYGKQHTLSDPLIPDVEALSDPAVMAALKERGVRILHGHFSASRVLEHTPDQARYWTWLRDPVARVVSNFLHRSNVDERPGAGENWRKFADMGLEAYARQKRARNRQSRMLEGLSIDQMGFVGITERYDESLAVLGFTPEAPVAARNVAKKKDPIDPALLDLIRDLNGKDMRLYKQAVARLERDKARLGEGPTPVSLLMADTK